MHTVRSQQNDTVARLCWRQYGTTSRPTLDAVFDANPDSCSDGPVLPNGTLVMLPDLTPSTPVNTLTQLWD